MNFNTQVEKNVDPYSCLAIKIHFFVVRVVCAVLLPSCALLGAYIKHMTALNACFI